MTTTIDTQNPSVEKNIADEPNTVESLAKATKALSFKDKEILLDLIGQQIFEEEEDNCVETEEAIKQLEASRAEFVTGDYTTFDDFLANRAE